MHNHFLPRDPSTLPTLNTDGEIVHDGIFSAGNKFDNSD